jgi:hypothetical protein
MIDQQKMAQAVIDTVKNYTATTMQVMKTSMEQYEKNMSTMLKQNADVREDGNKILADWMTKAKEVHAQYWNVMDENIKKMESFLNTDPQKKSK